MQVKLLEDIFNDTGSYADLDRLLNFFEEKRHLLLFDDSIDALFNSNWYKELNSRQKIVLHEYIEATAINSNKNKLLTISVSNTNLETNFCPAEAYLYLNQPLQILVENSLNEPPFLNAIFRTFDSDNFIKYAQKEKWIRYEMGGGQSITQVIDGSLQYDFINPVFNKPKHTYLRYFVIIDSDKTHREMVNNTVQAKEVFLNNHNLNYHILYKREKENYIPLDQLAQFDTAYFNLFLNFNEEQKDFFDIEKGFNNKNKSDGNWDENVKALFNFNNISKENWNILKRGVKQVNEFSEVSFKATFSELFNNSIKENMLARINHQPLYICQTDNKSRNEFEHIVNEIKKIL